MKGTLRRISCFFTLLFALLLSSIYGFAAENTEYKFTDVNPYKVWKIKFNKEIDEKYLKSVQAALKDQQGKITFLPISLSVDNKAILIEPPSGGYKQLSSYELKIPSGLKAKDGEILEKASSIKFNVREKIKIQGVLQERSYFTEGKDMIFYIYSNTDKEVQYNVKVTDINGKVYNITDGFSNNIKGNSTYKIKLDKLSSGQYLLNVYMKVVGEREIYTDDGIGYHDRYHSVFKVNKNNTKYDFMNDNIKFENFYFIEDNKYILMKNSTILNPSFEGKDDFEYSLKVMNVENGKIDKNAVKFGQMFKWSPKDSKDLLLEIGIKTSTGENLGSKVINVVTNNMTVKYVDYNMTVKEFAIKQKNNERMIIYGGNGMWRTPTLEEVEYYIDPQNFMDEYGMYQFLILNYVEGMTVEEVNEILKGKGILEGKGAAVLEGAKKYNINPAYLIAHIILETGHGKVSKLAKGIRVTSVEGKSVDPRIVYNMYGIQAIDANPNKYGSEYAYKQGWFTPEIAIIEGARWVGENYINSDKFEQNTLYEMRWNKSVMWHQYSTDVKWAYGQIKRIKDYLKNSENLKLVFEIPRYRK
ncbi:N-acetylglucosaminidase [Oceanirhabdus sp. W0125-5]|uniref:N-acetylglucosaminidase n=1 Tax=Oceanirhabdus sp. W0125-5 TaxID=2999116 RepID=UPI0022F2E427|nr:glucosaminidase domain-containing protein [Oceanirhabdus sp. W0125-5]WBW97381.1 glucosaminidase domain-containing protein [Oceanirhabdus sp. W0125-5]